MRFLLNKTILVIAAIFTFGAFSSFGFKSFFNNAGLPDKTIEIWDRSTDFNGYYFMAPLNTRKVGTPSKRSALMILDKKGTLIYYKQLALCSDFKLHPGRKMSYYNSGQFFVMDSLFNVIDSVKCIGNTTTDAHDFLILPNGNYLLIGKKASVEDFSNKRIFMRRGLPGSKRALAKYDVIQELNAKKQLVFEWDSRTIYRIDDADTYYLNDTVNVDVTHINSVDADEYDNLLISVRFFDEVVKVRKRDGVVIWRMGGKRNQIKLLNDSLPFLGQHDARFTGPGRFTVFDNGFGYDSLRHNPRGLEYEVDDEAKTAKLLWNHRCEFPLVCSSAGNIQRLQNGGTLIGYGKQENVGTKLAIEIFDPSGKEQTQAWYMDSLYTYRTFFYNYLPFKLERPAIRKLATGKQCQLSASQTFKYYKWSNGQTTQTIVVTKPGRYFVDVSNDGESFFRSEQVKF